LQNLDEQRLSEPSLRRHIAPLRKEIRCGELENRFLNYILKKFGENSDPRMAEIIWLYSHPLVALVRLKHRGRGLVEFLFCSNRKSSLEQR